MATDMVSREEPPAKRSRAGSIEEAPEISRSSSLKSPIMLLTGHDAPISTIKFDPSGRYVASAGHDRRICKTFYIQILKKYAHSCLVP